MNGISFTEKQNSKGCEFSILIEHFAHSMWSTIDDFDICKVLCYCQFWEKDRSKASAFS